MVTLDTIRKDMEAQLKLDKELHSVDVNADGEKMFIVFKIPWKRAAIEITSR